MRLPKPVVPAGYKTLFMFGSRIRRSKWRMGEVGFCDAEILFFWVRRVVVWVKISTGWAGDLTYVKGGGCGTI